MRRVICVTTLALCGACDAAAPKTLQLTVLDAAVALHQEGVATVAIAVEGTGAAGEISLLAAGLPAGVTATFAPSSTRGTHQMTLAAAPTAPLGTARVRVTAFAGTLTAVDTLDLTVEVRGTFSVSFPGPDAIYVDSGTTSSVHVVIERTGGYAHPVELEVSTSGTGLSVTVSRAPGSDSATVTLSSSMMGERYLRVTGTGPGRPVVRDSVHVRMVPGFYVWPDTNVVFAGMTRTLEGRSLNFFGHYVRELSGWTSSDASVASVTATGIVTAHAPGDATISASANGRTETAVVRVLAAPNPPLRFSQVFGSCGITVGEGKLMCWGAPLREQTDGWFDRCENTSRTLRSRFRCGEIPREVPTSVRFASMSSVDCGVGTDGRVYCRGTNDYGQLGIGTVDGDFHTYAPIAGDDRFTAVESGLLQSRCALRTDGKVLCWGRNWRGTLGNGSMSPDRNPTPAPIATSVAFTKLSSSTCALTGAGAVWCWGSYAATTAQPECNAPCTPTPQQIGVATASDLTGGCALSGGRVWCWGFHVDNASAFTPPTEASGPNMARLEAGFAYDSAGNSYEIRSVVGPAWRLVLQPLPVFRQRSGSCGIDTNGIAYCWGFDMQLRRIPGQ